MCRNKRTLKRHLISAVEEEAHGDILWWKWRGTNNAPAPKKKCRTVITQQQVDARKHGNMEELEGGGRLGKWSIVVLRHTRRVMYCTVLHRFSGGGGLFFVSFTRSFPDCFRELLMFHFLFSFLFTFPSVTDDVNNPFQPSEVSTTLQQQQQQQQFASLKKGHSSAQPSWLTLSCRVEKKNNLLAVLL